MRVAIGVGCRKNCPSAAIEEIVRETLAHLRGPAEPAGLFTVSDKAAEPGMRHAAERLGLPLVPLERAVLSLVAGQARSCSRRVEEMFGLPGIAETAALAGAGQGAALLVSRRGNAVATCAIAGRVEP